MTGKIEFYWASKLSEALLPGAGFAPFVVFVGSSALFLSVGFFGSDFPVPAGEFVSSLVLPVPEVFVLSDGFVTVFVLLFWSIVGELFGLQNG